MQSIKKRLSIILIFCSIIAVILSAAFVNFTISNTFKVYLSDLQTKRNTRLIQYFEQVYVKNGQWFENSGEEMMHEAYMSNYCLSLLDKDKNVIWGMKSEDIQNSGHLNKIWNEEGVYSENILEINVDGKVVGYLNIGQYSSILLSKEDVVFKNNINKSIAVSAFLTIIIGVAISIVLSKQFSSPIKAVSDVSVSLSQNNYDARSNIKSDITEINNLINSINLLGEKLNSQDLIRKRLVSDISHEIRTPLNVLQNNLEAMVDGLVPITTERLSNLNNEVIRFDKLINNLDVLKEFELESIRVHMEQLAVNKIISVICEDFSLAAANRNVSIKLNSYEDYLILGDRDSLKQVFINLISNAIKFSKDKGEVVINIKTETDFILVQISDDGFGIKEEDLPFIFERMYRGDKSRNKIKGDGLGLTLVKQILNIHNATIHVDSKEGKGTVVNIRFKKMSL